MARRVTAMIALVALGLAGCGDSGATTTEAAPTTEVAATVVSTTTSTTSNQPDDLTTATDLVDQWVDGWNAEDPNAIVAVLTQDASYRDPNGGGGSDRDQIYAFAESRAGCCSNIRRGAGRVTETGTFVFPFSFDYDTGSHAGEIEVELDGDLVSRIHWLYWDTVHD